MSVHKEVLYSVTFLIYETVSMSYSDHIKSVLAQLCRKMHLVCIEITVLCHEDSRTIFQMCLAAKCQPERSMV